MRATAAVLLSTFAVAGCGGSSASNTSPEIFRPSASNQRVADFADMNPTGIEISADVSRPGFLTINDYLVSGNDTYAQVWHLMADAGEQVTVDLVSDNFDAYLYVDGPGVSERNDDGAGACNSRITFTARESAPYRVTITTLGARETGPFTVRTYSRGPFPSYGDSCLGAGFSDDNIALEMMDMTVAGELEEQMVVNRELNAADPEFSDGTPVEVWSFQGNAGDYHIFEMVSTDFDTKLFMAGQGITLTDDDGGANCNSRIEVTLPSTGSYMIGASAWSSSASGTFELRAVSSRSPDEPGACGGGDFDNFSGNLMEADPRGTLRLGEEVRTTLSIDDSHLVENREADVWTFRANQAGQYYIELASTDFDTYLYVGTDDWLDSSDDDFGNCNSRFTVDLATGEAIRVAATSFGGNYEGDYTLRVVTEPSPEQPGGCSTDFGGSGFDVPGSCESTAYQAEANGALREGSLTESSFDAGDPTCEVDEYAEVWEFAANEGQSYTIDVMSSEFDTYMWLVGPGMDGPLSDDDMGGACNARIELTAPSTGTYRVIATTFASGITGSYSVRVTRGTGVPIDDGVCPGFDDFEGEVGGFADWNAAVAAVVPEFDEIESGDVVTEELTDNDYPTEVGTLARAYVLSARAGEEFTVELESEDFDTYLVIHSTLLEDIIEDDDGLGNLNSAATFTAPASGDYKIIVSSFASSSTGEFTLRVIQNR